MDEDTRTFLVIIGCMLFLGALVMHTGGENYELKQDLLECECSSICDEHGLEYGYYENSVKEYCVCQDITDDGVIEKRYLKNGKEQWND